MLYLSLHLCSKFSIGIPYLLPIINDDSHCPRNTSKYNHTTSKPGHNISNSNDSSNSTHPAPLVSSPPPPRLPPHHTAAAPPTYLLILPLVPVTIATYVASSRYSDFRHHGFDIIFGSLLGAVIAWGSFRMYHLPVRRSSGWAWGSRRGWEWGKLCAGVDGGRRRRRGDGADGERGERLEEEERVDVDVEMGLLGERTPGGRGGDVSAGRGDGSTTAAAAATATTSGNGDGSVNGNAGLASRPAVRESRMQGPHWQ